jgi:hypothetical protein
VHGNVGAIKPTQRNVVKNGSKPSLPHAPPSVGLKMPKQGKTRHDIDKRLKKTSPWFTSIVDPLHGADCKIPDDIGVETGTLQLVQKFALTLNSAGFGGFKVQSPYVNSKTDVSGASPGTGCNVQQIDPTSTPTTIRWGATTSAGAFVNGAGESFVGVGELKAITNMHRVVSACLIVQPEVSLADNKGEYGLFMRPFADETSPTYNDYLNSYKAIVVPLNVNRPGQVNWYPTLRQDLNFKSFMRTTGTASGSDDSNSTFFPNWNFGLVANGCAAGASFRVTVVVNYEFVPSFNTLNVLDASPSPSDAAEIDLVEQWIQEEPTAKVTTNAKVSSSPSSVEPAHGENDEGTGFGMFFNVIKELAPLALALI